MAMISCIDEFEHQLSNDDGGEDTNPRSYFLHLNGLDMLALEEEEEFLSKVGRLLSSRDLVKYILISDRMGLASIMIFSVLEDDFIATTSNDRRIYMDETQTTTTTTAATAATTTIARKDMDQVFARCWTKASMLKRLNFLTCRAKDPDVGAMTHLLETSSLLLEIYGYQCRLIVQKETTEPSSSVLNEYLIHSQIECINITGEITGGLPQHLLGCIKSGSYRELKKLDLSWCGLDSGDARVIADILETNPPLTSLSLYGNSIDDRGMQSIAIAVKHNTHLEILGLEDKSAVMRTRRRRARGCGTGGLVEFLKTLKTNKTLRSIDLCPTNVNNSRRTIAAIKECLEHNIGLGRVGLTIEFRNCPCVFYALKDLVPRSKRRFLDENRLLLDAAKTLSNERLLPKVLEKTKRPIMMHQLLTERMDLVVQALQR